MVGLSTACFFPMETEKTVPLIHDLGFSVAEVFLQAAFEYEPDYLRILRASLEEAGVCVHSVHAFCTAFEPYLFAEYERRRQDALATFVKVARAARFLGASYYTFHGNLKAATGPDFDYARFARQMRELSAICREEGVQLAWENVAWCQSCDPGFIRRALEYIGAGEICFTLDLKQARRAGGSVQDYIEIMGQDLATVHINDQDAQHTCLLPGAGTFDYRPLLVRLSETGYTGPFIIEVYRENFEVLDEISRSRQYVESMLKKYRAI